MFETYKPKGWPTVEAREPEGPERIALAGGVGSMTAIPERDVIVRDPNGGLHIFPRVEFMERWEKVEPDPDHADMTALDEAYNKSGAVSDPEDGVAGLAGVVQEAIAASPIPDAGNPPTPGLNAPPDEPLTGAGPPA